MKNSDKIYAWANVAVRLLIVDVLLRVLAIVVYPPVYILRKPIRWVRRQPLVGWLVIPLWIFLDDSGDYGNKEECWDVIGVEPTNWWRRLMVAYYWSGVRNVAWNSYTFPFFKGVNSRYPFTNCTFNRRAIYSYNEGDLKLGKVTQVSIYSPNTRMNRAKFYSYSRDGVRSVSSNEGVYLDLELSYFGNSIYYFQNNGKWWVLLTRCRIRKIKNGVLKISEWNVGAVDTRVLWRCKPWQRCLIEK